MVALVQGFGPYPVPCQNSSCSQRLGFSVGKTNYILKALVEKGLIKVECFAHSKNKLNYHYVLTTKGISQHITLTECFIERKQREYQQLSQELESLKVSQQQENHGPLISFN